jgi:hypothetical protein
MGCQTSKTASSPELKKSRTKQSKEQHRSTLLATPSAQSKDPETFALHSNSQSLALCEDRSPQGLDKYRVGTSSMGKQESDEAALLSDPTACMFPDIANVEDSAMNPCVLETAMSPSAQHTVHALEAAMSHGAVSLPGEEEVLIGAWTYATFGELMSYQITREEESKKMAFIQESLRGVLTWNGDRCEALLTDTKDGKIIGRIQMKYLGGGRISSRFKLEADMKWGPEIVATKTMPSEATWVVV